jgi:hypothetical protein
MIKIKKGFNSYHRLGNLDLEDNKIYINNNMIIDNKRDNLAKNYLLLTNAFGSTKLIKRNSNKGMNPLDFLNDLKKEKGKLNIFNYKKTCINKKGNHQINTKYIKDNDENLLQSLLTKIDKKNIQNILKNQENKIRLQRKSLIGILFRNHPLNYNVENGKFKTINKAKSVKYINNKNIGLKTLPKLFSKMSNDTFLNNIRENNKRNSKLIKNYSQTVNQKIKDMFNSINSEEKNVEKTSRIFNYNMYLNNDKTFLNTYRTLTKKINSNSFREVKFRRNINRSYIKNALKIKNKKDFEKILYLEDTKKFNDAKNKLLTLYKTKKKLK